MSFTAHPLEIAPSELKAQLRRAANAYDAFCLLETGSAFQDPLDDYQFLAAGGARQWHRVPQATSSGWSQFKTQWRERPTWLFGVLAYDLKNAMEPGLMSHPKGMPFQDDLCLFEPEWVVEVTRLGEVILHCHGDSKAWLAALRQHAHTRRARSDTPTWAQDWTHADYLQRAEQIAFHLNRGDIYEANLCFRHFCESNADPVEIYEALMARTQAPMAGLFRCEGQWLICGSPERYLHIGDHEGLRWVHSQPIKGTAPRDVDPRQDALNAGMLRSSEKEQAENVMIVDLVRNDLSHVAAPSSVTVPRYLEVRTLPTVHHLISTVQAQLNHEKDWLDAVTTSFPMGSMTGAPKVSAMKIIQSQESARRGWYSGSLGFIRPDGTGDWNVIIRSLLHDSDSGIWEVWAGSAITLQAEATDEWDECSLKLEAMHQALSS